MNYNISASSFVGFSQLDNVTKMRERSSEKLSSGYRLNRAGDDSAGSSISAALRAQIRGLDQGNRNAEDAVNMLNTAESGMSGIAEILQRLRELSVQSANGLLTPDDRQSIVAESKQLMAEVNRIATTTEFNTIRLLGGVDSPTGTGRSLTSVVGKNNITPDGTLSEKYDLWTILGSTLNGDNCTNIGKIINSTSSTGVANSSGDHIALSQNVSTCHAVSAQKVHVYNNFRLNGASYAGDLYDAAGNVIGNVSGSSADATVRSAGASLLPENAVYVTLNDWKEIEYSSKAPTYAVTNTTGAKEINRSTSDTITADKSQVYAKVNGTLTQLSYRDQTVDRAQCEIHIENQKYDYEVGAISIDFQKLNQPGGFVLADLYDTGFNSTCATCSQHYSIKFVQGKENELTGINVDGYFHYTLNIGLDVLKTGATGEDVAKLVVDSVKVAYRANGSFNHYTQYAYNGSTLYAFECRPGHSTTAERNADFSAIAYDDLFKQTEYKATKHIQVGADSYQTIDIELPVINTRTLGLLDVNLGNEQSASDSITLIDSAIQTLTLERSKVASWTKRIQSSASYDEKTSLYTTDGESRIRDTDIASEMIDFSKYQVLEEYGVNVVSEVNRLITNVLEFIQ